MTITRDQIHHVANLARLDLPESSLDTFADQIGQIMEYVDKLEQVNTAGITATSHATQRSNAFREDDPTGGIRLEEALANAPRQEDGCFIVPKVIEEK
jgi:aspartyl-tRNA(Asn)/glutamyl-tRNA(Gln) amidotransferase subunit C